MSHAAQSCSITLPLVEHDIISPLNTNHQAKLNMLPRLEKLFFNQRCAIMPIKRIHTFITIDLLFLNKYHNNADTFVKDVP